uniref:Uncharacterized protein n=1 Tax=Ascaris lumbricoides TaxID=6252 RepID=A0A0M3IP29_ASCLU
MTRRSDVMEITCCSSTAIVFHHKLSRDHPYISCLFSTVRSVHVYV